MLYFKKIPFLRPLIALVAGIVLEDHLYLDIHVLAWLFIIIAAFIFLFEFLSEAARYSLRWLKGILILAIFLIIGSLVVFIKDIRNNRFWIKNYEYQSAQFLVTLKEPPEKKSKTFKAEVSIDAIYKNNSWQNVKANLILYLKTDSLVPGFSYGSRLIFNKPLQPILNPGNPAQFDYERYLALRNLYFQVYLEPADFIILPDRKTNLLNQFLVNTRKTVLQIIQKNIPGDKEKGVAQALLVGYRGDLDKELMQSYSNTGVVHIISISGLHVGLIYGLTVWLLSILKIFQKRKFLKAVFILSIVWLFALVAGADPSVLRSATMFSFLVIADGSNRKTNIYNTLAASAFCLLIFNPYFLWDVGFQLSYTAVLSIVLFMKPIYHLLYFKNKIIDGVWSLSAVTISAQIMTLPLVFYYFHQFPNLFIIANIIVVPLSGFILYGELLLVLVSKFTWLAYGVGFITGAMLTFMNSFIDNINQFPNSVTTGIQINFIQTIFLYGVIIFCAAWLLNKNVQSILYASICLLVFVSIRSIDIIGKNKQQKLMLYHLPQSTAIDIFDGKNYHFIGDSMVSANVFLQNFHLNPSRTMHRVQSAGDHSIIENKFILVQSRTKKLLIIHKLPEYAIPEQKMMLDAIILRKNANVSISRLLSFYDCNEVVFDNSNSLWKIERWKKECDSLHLRFHSVNSQGAYELDL